MEIKASPKADSKRFFIKKLTDQKIKPIAIDWRVYPIATTVIRYGVAIVRASHGDGTFLQNDDNPAMNNSAAKVFTPYIPRSKYPEIIFRMR